MKTEKWEPPEPRQQEAIPACEMAKTKGNEPDAATQKARFELIQFDKIRLDTTPAYLIKGIIPRVGLIIVWGPPKCGKSFLVFDLAMHIALGWPYRGRRVRQGAIVYCAFEGQAGLKNRVEAFRQKKLSEGADGIPFYLMADAMNLVADHQALVASVRATLGDTKPAAIVLDTLNRSLAGSEGDDGDMGAYMKAADALRIAFDCAAIIVHHCGHEGTRPRGHSSLIGNNDAQIAVKKDAAGNILAVVEHMKDGPQGDEFASRLEVVELGLDDDGDKIMSCIIAPVECLQPSAKASVGIKLTKAKNALSALNYAIGECGVVPPASNHIPAGVKCVKADQWREYAYRMAVSSSEEQRARQKAFKTATEALIASGRIGAWDPWVWAL